MQFQLQHMDSGAFLQISKSQADNSKDCYKYELTMEPVAERVTFSILPRFKYRQEGDRVVYGDHILLHNASRDVYVHYDPKLPLPVETNTLLASSYRPNDPLRKLQSKKDWQL
jgi:hypothetical protein